MQSGCTHTLLAHVRTSLKVIVILSDLVNLEVCVISIWVNMSSEVGNFIKALLKNENPQSCTKKSMQNEPWQTAPTSPLV